MEVFPWKEQYSVGIASIDKQHQKLVAYLNDIYKALGEGKGKESLGQIFSGLIEYTKTHFASEEGLMKLYDYPGYEEHRQIHDKMTAHVLGLGEKFKKGEISSPIQIANFLKDWLSKHIQETDKGYGPFLNSKGCK
ncbi:MAG: hemerythrin [Desulfobacteraceae bacterium]|nr:MAG: hemerythrin [Desulfobacteraceae bacterium]